MYTATITGTNGETFHTTNGGKDSMQSVYKWASVQGIAGHDVIETIGCECALLINCHTGERARLNIECSDVIQPTCKGAK